MNTSAGLFFARSAICRRSVDMIGDFCVSLIFLSDKTLCPASPSLGWVAWVSLPHLPGLSCSRPSVLCSAKTTALPSRVASLVARFPVPRYPTILFVFLSARIRAVGCPFAPGLLVYRSPWFRFVYHEELAVLSSSQVTPVCTCPVQRLRWCPRCLPYHTRDSCLPAK